MMYIYTYTLRPHVISHTHKHTHTHSLVIGPSPLPDVVLVTMTGLSSTLYCMEFMNTLSALRPNVSMRVLVYYISVYKYLIA